MRFYMGMVLVVMWDSCLLRTSKIDSISYAYSHSGVDRLCSLKYPNTFLIYPIFYQDGGVYIYMYMHVYMHIHFSAIR